MRIEWCHPFLSVHSAPRRLVWQWRHRPEARHPNRADGSLAAQGGAQRFAENGGYVPRAAMAGEKEERNKRAPSSPTTGPHWDPHVVGVRELLKNTPGSYLP